MSSRRQVQIASSNDNHDSEEESDSSSRSRTGSSAKGVASDNNGLVSNRSRNKKQTQMDE